MDSLFDRLSVWSVRHRWAVVLLIAAISGVALVGHINPELVLGLFRSPAVDDAEAISGGEAKAFERPPDVKPLSLAGADAVLVVEGDEFFTSRTAEALRAVVDDLEDLPQVSSILWMDRVPILNIFGLPEPLLPKSSASAMRFDAAKEKARKHPLVYGQLLSDDGRTLLMLVNYDYYHILSDADATSLLTETARKTAARFPESDLRFRITGRMPTAIAAISSHEANQLKYQLIGYGMILFMTLILFRGIRAVIIVSLAPIMGVFWTLGFVRFLGYNDNPLVDVILPILVSLVGLTDGVHLMVQIRKLRSDGLGQREAAQLGLAQVGLACFLTSLTTAIGFGSLMLADSAWVRQFGLSSTIGVVLCFVAIVTVIPLACSTWLGAKVHEGQKGSLIDRNLGKISGLVAFVLTRRRLFSLAGIVGTLLLGATALTLTPDQRQSDGLPQSAEATQALFHVDEAFGGLEFADVDIRWSEQVDSSGPEVLVVVSAVDDLLRQEPLIGHPLSIRNLIDAQPGSGPPEERMTLLELLPPPLKRAFFTPEYRSAKVSFRVRDLGIAQYGPVFRRVEAGLAKIQSEHPEFSMELTGGAVWRWRNLYQIVVDLAASLGTASIIILLVLAFVYRSIRLGLISIVPNLFPLAFTGAYLVWAGYNLEIVMVCNFTICLGIAVDDTIHFLTRYREERAGCTSNDEAIRRAFTGVGTALIMTTSVLVAGFAIVTFSDSRDHRIFAMMGALTISAALFCDLLFLPALLSWFGGDGGSGNSKSGRSIVSSLQ